jgi:nucleotide-binding universal stress UspA family protein
MKLFRNSPCPVLANRDPRKFKHRSIVAAVDLESSDDEIVEMNQQIVSLAASLARRAGGQLVLFHSWYLWGEHLLAGRAGMSPEDILQMVGNVRSEREVRANELLDSVDLEGQEVEVVLQKGEARRLLPKFVDNNETDLVVMGSVSRTGLQGFLMGNTAERVLNELPCSVITVKPPGFESPIRAADD